MAEQNLPMASADQISFQPATPADRDWLFALHERSMRPMVERIFGEWNSATQRSKFDARTETDVRLVLAGGEPVGAVYLEDKPDGALDISLIEIDPAHQNQGLGGATIQRLAAEAAAADRAVTLGVRKLNPAAKRLYERLGFRVIGDDETHFRMRREPGAESGSDSLGPSTA